MKANFYYNYKSLGDVLLIVIDENKIPTSYIKDNDIVLIYQDKDLIGINYFNISSICKIKGIGQIYSLPSLLLKIINDKLTKYQVAIEENTIFLVGKIIEKELGKVKIDLNNEIIILDDNNYDINKLCVIKVDSKINKICSFKDLKISSSDDIVYLEENEAKVGQNFYISKGV